MSAPLPRAGTPFDCDEVARGADAYLDGEFAEDDRAGLESHLAECAECARRVRGQAAFKAQLRSALRTAPAPAALRERVRFVLTRSEPALPAWRRASAKLVPAAAAAVVLVGATWSARERSSPVAAAAILRHEADLPVEVTGGVDQVRQWFTHKVDFAVKPPRLPNAALVGARLASLRDHDAAYLVYTVSGAKVSVFVFAADDLPFEAPRRREAAGHQIYLQGERGYNVAMFRHGGVGYAFASDLPEERMIQLVSSAVAP
jgi:anti-sigma factor (TIGR02949 family)